MPTSALEKRLQNLMKIKVAAQQHAEAAVAKKFLAKSKMSHAHASKASMAAFASATREAESALLEAQKTEEAYMEAKLQAAAAKKPKPPALAALTQTPIQPVVAKPATPAAPMDLFVVQEDYAPSPAEEQYAPQAQ